MLRCGSSSSTLPDAYRAGIEVGEALRHVEPEIALLFASVDYENETELLFEGLYDGLGTRAVRLFGGTGDGVCESNGVSQHGVAALALNTGGAMRWHIATASGLGQDSALAAETCARRALELAGGEPRFAMVLADAFKADGVAVVEGISRVLQAPFFGGLVGDNRKFRRGIVFCDGMALDDSVALLVGVGNMSCTLHGASGCKPTGPAGLVDRSAGNTVLQINGRPAQVFVREQLGKAIGEVDLGMVPLAVSDGPRFFLRTPVRIEADTGGIATAASIAEGSTLRVCQAASPADIMQGVDEALDGALRGRRPPEAAVVISCAARKWILDDRCSEEVHRVFERLGRRIPLAGIPSFGEFGPIRQEDGSYSPAYFHNVTFVVCFLGELDEPTAAIAR